jgi:hypothetical protein
VAIFLAFQSQAWPTNDQTGHAIPTPQPGQPGAPDHTVRIVAALVNPVGPAPEAETVTLLNVTPEAVDLTAGPSLTVTSAGSSWTPVSWRPGTASGSCSGHRSPWATAVGSSACWIPMA